MPETKPLTLKRQAFVDAYLGNGGNATRAYKDAGYAASNDNIAASEASKLIRIPKVAHAITKAKAAQQTRVERVAAVDAEWAQQRLLDLYARNTGVTDVDLPEARRCIESLAKLCDLYPRHDAQVAPSSVTNVVNLLADASPSDVLALFRGETPALPPGGDDMTISDV